ncbi:MAG: redox-sensitive transcriptional activator SoxR [Micromonosporaceae bacterium]
MATEQVTIGELAARTGVAASALRYYERMGLIRAVRTGGNQRRYARSVIRRVSFIRIAQRVGLTLDEIRDALATLPQERTPTKEDWSRLSRRWRQHLDDQVTLLQRLREDLDGCIGCGCLSLKKCTLYNPRDVLAEQGSGPRLLLRGLKI